MNVNKELNELIERVKSDIECFNNLGKYNKDAYYDRCSAKADYAEEILSLLKEIVENEKKRSQISMKKYFKIVEK